MYCGVVDRGLRTGPEHAALDTALLEAGKPALHFARYRPTASLGAHEAAELAVRESFCRQQAIPLIRRPTGGGTLYLDPDQLAWSCLLPADGAGLGRWMARHLRAVAAALAGLGLDARVREPNDLEVEGRKLASCFADVSGRGVLLQGVLLFSLDTETLLKVLRVPMEKLSAEGVQSARQRFTTLSELFSVLPSPAEVREALTTALAAEFGFEPIPAEMADTPPDAAMPAGPSPLPAAGYAFAKGRGAVLHAWVRPDETGKRFEAVRLAGALHCAPRELLTGLAEQLQGSGVAGYEARVNAYLSEGGELLGLRAGEINRLIAQTLERSVQQAELGLDPEEANTLMVHGDLPARAVLERATVMLVPYCAKPPDCLWRHRDGCPECGLCEVGDAYRLARERGLRVVSVTHFEHLQETLQGMRTGEVPAYVGMCCQNFYLKRHYAFEAAGIPAVLMDISGANCYELQQEDLAYAGRFEARARLNGEVVEKVMRFVPTVANTGKTP